MTEICRKHNNLSNLHQLSETITSINVCTVRNWTPIPHRNNCNFCLSCITIEVTFGPQVAHTLPQYGELVQLGYNLLCERKLAGQPVQLSIQPVPMSFGRIWFDTFRRRLLHTKKGEYIQIYCNFQNMTGQPTNL